MMNEFLPFTKPFIDEETILAVGDTLRSGWISSGPKVIEFEKKLSEYFGGRPVRTFNSGTATLEVALRIAGIGHGDEVITTPISWVATANVILTVGAEPVFVDIDPATRNIDLDKVEYAITSRTKAIIPVHLAGLPVDMDKLYALAKKHQLRVIEDAAQALGSSWKDSPIGSLGDLISFSFQANKNITTAEGGCLVLNNEKEATLAEKYRLQGLTRNGLDEMEVDVLGGKFNMTDIAATLGLGQLPQLASITSRRRTLARLYFDTFSKWPIKELGLQLPKMDFVHSNWHLFQIILPDNISRSTFMHGLKSENIGSGVHYPPIHLFKLYRELGFKESMLPIAEHVGKQIVTLPLFPSMKEHDVTRVCEATIKILNSINNS